MKFSELAQIFTPGIYILSTTHKISKKAGGKNPRGEGQEISIIKRKLFQNLFSFPTFYTYVNLRSLKQKYRKWWKYWKEKQIYCKKKIIIPDSK